MFTEKLIVKGSVVFKESISSRNLHFLFVFASEMQLILSIIFLGKQLVGGSQPKTM